MSSCLLCGSESHQEVFREPHAFFEEEEYVLVRCTGCGLMRAEPPLPVDYHEAALPEDYSEEDVEDYLFRKRLGEFGKKLSLIHKFKRGGRLLDVGCHLGHFMRFAQREGWDVWGLDVADGYTAYAREKGLKNVFTTSLREARLQENFFDVVTIWNTLEHLSQPLEELKEVNRILKREGIIALSLPCARYVRLKVFFLSRVPLLRGLLFPDLESLLPHTHLFNFTPKTAEALLARAGFEPLLHEPLKSLGTSPLLEGLKPSSAATFLSLWNRLCLLLFYLSSRKLVLSSSFLLLAKKRR